MNQHYYEDLPNCQKILELTSQLSREARAELIETLNKMYQLEQLVDRRANDSLEFAASIYGF